MLWACGFRKKAKGEVARAQSALKGTFVRDRAGADVGENMCWFTSDPRPKVEILTRHHSRKKNMVSDKFSTKKETEPKWVSLDKRLKKRGQQLKIILKCSILAPVFSTKWPLRLKFNAELKPKI